MVDSEQQSSRKGTGSRFSLTCTLVIAGQVSISAGTLKNVLTSIFSARKQEWQKLSKRAGGHADQEQMWHLLVMLPSAPNVLTGTGCSQRSHPLRVGFCEIWKVNSWLPQLFYLGGFINFQEEFKQNIHTLHISIWGNILDMGLSCFPTQVSSWEATPSAEGGSRQKATVSDHLLSPTRCYPQPGNRFPDTSEFKKHRCYCRTSGLWVFVFF